jgi:glycosyltransferase involved in cell wall biosynthesis
VDTHPGDLEIMGSAVADIIRDNDDVDLHVVGYPERVAEVLGVPSDRVTGTDWVPFDKYHEALQGIDVMFVPLADTLFNQAKSALKAQEAAAAGCLVVASATPENERLYALGGFVGGTLGSDDNHLWGEALDIGIDAIRKGFTGKPERARFLSYEERAVRWADAWKGAVERRRLMNR